MNRYVVEMNNVSLHSKVRKNLLNIEKFTLSAGEFAAVVGPNGAGKSTLLSVINMLEPYKGEIRLFRENVNKVDKTMLRRRCALIFQDMLLVDDTVYNNVAMALKFRGVSAKKIKEKVYSVLADFSCEHLAHRKARELSGGEKQRVCIARALVTDPELLLMDEPSASLDTVMRNEMLEKIRQIASERGISVIMVSHNFTDVLNFAERVIVMFDGSIVQDAAPEILMQHPVNESVAKLVGMDNIIPCSIEQNNKDYFVKLSNGIKFLYPNLIDKPIKACCLPGDAIHIYDENFSVKEKSVVVIDGLVERVLPDIGSYHIVVKSGKQSLNLRVPRKQIVNNIYNNMNVKVAFAPVDTHLV